MADPVGDTRARNRWMVVQLGRIGGVALTVVGIMVLTGEMALPREAGWAALALGLGGSLVLPALLVRRWRSPRP